MRKLTFTFHRVWHSLISEYLSNDARKRNNFKVIGLTTKWLCSNRWITNERTKTGLICGWHNSGFMLQTILFRRNIKKLLYELIEKKKNLKTYYYPNNKFNHSIQMDIWIQCFKYGKIQLQPIVFQFYILESTVRDIHMMEARLLDCCWSIKYYIHSRCW